jgi:MOSC domain-containing protein YiiM
MADATHLSMAELESQLDHIRKSPRDEGVLELIVSRPRVNARELLETAELDPELGLVGDRWTAGGSGAAHRDTQLTMMNARVIALVAQTKEHWALAGDQLYIDLDLSAHNLTPGTRLQIGSAIIEVTAEPHLGCKKFRSRFGLDAMQFVNSPIGRELHLRGVNARVVQPGFVRVGDLAKKL